MPILPALDTMMKKYFAVQHEGILPYAIRGNLLRQTLRKIGKSGTDHGFLEKDQHRSR